MVMVAQSQRTVYCPDASANGASNYCAHGTCDSITSMRAFLGAADQTLRVRNHGR